VQGLENRSATKGERRLQFDHKMAADGALPNQSTPSPTWSIGDPMIRLFRLHVPLSLLLLFFADVVILFGVIVLGLVLSYVTTSKLPHSVDLFGTQQVVFVVVLLGSLYTMGLHHRRYIADRKIAFLRLIASHLVAFIALTTIFYVVPTTRIWLSALIPSLGLSFICLSATRLAFVRLARVSLFRHRVLILGAGTQAQKIQNFEDNSHFKCVGFVASNEQIIEVAPDRVITKQGSLSDLAIRHGATEIVISLEERRGCLPTEELLACRLQGMQVSNFSSFMERETGQVEIESLDLNWLIFADGFSVHHRLQRSIKRAFDIVVSLALIVFTIPILIPAALAIWLEDRGPFLYRQTRTGLYGRTFMLLKFRSMKMDAEADGIARWASAHDARVTKVGALIRKVRVDEIPQVINVLQGDMSFVGPRPERPSIVDELSRTIPFYRHRHSVKPGITGWAQVNYPYGASMEDARQKLKFDLYYIKNYTLILDILILMQTARVVLWPQGSR